MRDLNIDFMDLYKRVDKFIKDAYSSSTGVSEYIEQMELNNIKGTFYLSTWKEDYHQLKQMRWIRNQLAHEVEYDADICSIYEYEWLNEFYKRLFERNDPLAVIYDIDKYKNKAQKIHKPENSIPKVTEKKAAPIRVLKRLSNEIPEPLIVKEEVKEKADKKRITNFIKRIKNALSGKKD